jgi:hypothetical protein
MGLSLLLGGMAVKFLFSLYCRKKNNFFWALIPQLVQTSCPQAEIRRIFSKT